MSNNQYNTLSEAVNTLNQRGYILNFTLKPDGIYSKKEDLSFGPDAFEVDEFHRFEGMTNPSDSSIVYAITTKDGRKGTMTDAYGAYADPPSKEMLQKLKAE
jgi:hypothetical protein